MKLLMAALLLSALLLTAATAHAFAVYNHVDATVDVTKDWRMGVPLFKVGPKGTYNGKHGAGLDSVYVWWIADKLTCYGSDNFSIPKGGFARIYKSEVKIYDHQNKHLRSAGVGKAPCD